MSEPTQCPKCGAKFFKMNLDRELFHCGSETFSRQADYPVEQSDQCITNELLATVERLTKDKERLDWLEKTLSDTFRQDVILQSDYEDGVWISLAERGLTHSIAIEGQDDKSDTIREAIDNARGSHE